MYALVALGAALPSLASAAITAATTATIQAPAGNVPPGSTVSVICRAEGNTTSAGMGLGSTTSTITRIDVTVDGGTVSPAQFTDVRSQTCSSGTGSCSWLEGTASWTTPPTAGTYVATCTVSYTDENTYTGLVNRTTTRTGSITTVAVSFLPPIVGPVTGPGEAIVGGTSIFEVSATDPNGWPLTYQWTATGGVMVMDPSNHARASWTVPTTPGAYTVTVSVSNGPFAVPAQKSVNVVLAAYQAGLPLPLVAPRRVVAGDAGALYVVDGQQQGATGQVLLATARGEARGFAAVPEPALAVTSGAGVLWVTTTAGNLFKVDPVTGRDLGKVALEGGPFGSPAGIAYDAANMTLWVADSGSNVVRVIRPDGTTVTTIAAAGGAALVQPVDVAVDAGKAWVLIYQAKTEDALAGEPIAAARYLHTFDGAGQYLASYVSQGNGAGQLVRAGGIAVGPAGVYVTDVHEGRVQVFKSTGAPGQPVGAIGSWGQEPGQLMNPWGLDLMANGDLAVANTSNSRIERYGSGAPLPSCAGDADCDLLPDAWESASGLNSSWAGDALLDLDADGLNNAAEHAAGTNPGAADTDGDGYSDADELATGFDPTNPDDHKATVTASGPGETPPGLVKLRATATGPVPCTVGWTQEAGPSVTLNGADSDAPSFVARAAGTYAFDARATCGALQSNPSRATVVVRNVAPLADAGGVLVAAPGTPLRLDALASSDANGETLAFTWDQTLGAPLVGTQSGGAFTARPRGAGLYAFQVTVEDGAGQVSTAEVPVLVAEGQAPTAIAAAFPAETQAGPTARVDLDASTSVVHEGSTFSWRQLSGPGVTLAGADQPVASFVATQAGRYAFDVVAGSGPMRTPPARVEVFVAEAGGALPTVAAAAPPIVAVGQPVSLDATPTPAAAQVAWRQLSGPAAGLTEADRATATVVPFSPGFHVFEVTVRDGAAEGRPARVAFEARAGGTAIPQARVSTAPGDAWVGQLVFLDGRASTGAARFRWTQVAGPWVALGSQSSVATIRPLAVGLYAFELVVDDGTTRSAPARVEVNVVAPGGLQ